MGFDAIRDSDADRRADEDGSAERHHVPCVVVEAGTDKLVVNLLSDGPFGRSGRTMEVRQAFKGRSIVDLLAGRIEDSAGGTRPPTGPGDVVILGHARVHTSDAVLYASGVIARIHDGLRGEVQVIRAPIRPTRHTVGKSGFTQFAEIVDPHYALRTRDRTVLVELLDKAMRRPWPGGEAGISVVPVGGIPVRIVDKRRAGAAEAIAEAFDMDILGKGVPLDVVPSWVLPLGRDHSIAETDLTKESKSSYGRISGLYATGVKHAQFRDSFAIVADEEAWSFGAPTGKTQRTALGICPVIGSPLVSIEGYRARRTGPAAGPMRFLWEPDRMAAAVAARDARRGPEDASTRRIADPAGHPRPTSASLRDRRRDDEDEGRAPFVMRPGASPFR